MGLKMKKTALFILILLCILLCSGCKVATMKEKHIIDGTLVTVLGGSFNFVELDTGKTKTFSIEEYDKPIGKTEIVADENSIYIFENGKWSKLPLEGYEMREKPVRINDSVFFVSCDLNRTGLYIWKYENGKTEKFSDYEVGFWGGLLVFEDNLIYGTNDNIICCNISSGEKEVLTQGYYFSWKEEGKSIYYRPVGKNGLWIYDIETGTKEIVDDELHLLGNPVYNADNNVILITCDDPLNYGSNEYIVGGLYYPESNDFVYWKSYAKRMNIPFDITKQEWFEASVTHTYWN